MTDFKRKKVWCFRFKKIWTTKWYKRKQMSKTLVIKVSYVTSAYVLLELKIMKNTEKK